MPVAHGCAGLSHKFCPQHSSKIARLQAQCVIIASLSNFLVAVCIVNRCYFVLISQENESTICNELYFYVLSMHQVLSYLELSHVLIIVELWYLFSSDSFNSNIRHFIILCSLLLYPQKFC